MENKIDVPNHQPDINCGQRLSGISSVLKVWCRWHPAASNLAAVKMMFQRSNFGMNCRAAENDLVSIGVHTFSTSLPNQSRTTIIGSSDKSPSNSITS